MIGISSIAFKKMGFTHYVNHGNGQTSCFAMEICENCGEQIQAANGIGGSASDIPFYKLNNMIGVSELPAEGYYSDDLGGEACNNCNG